MFSFFYHNSPLLFKEYREEQIYFEFLILNINSRISLYAKPNLQDLRGSKVVPAVMAGCRTDTGRGRQDLCTPLTDSGGEVSPPEISE